MIIACFKSKQAHFYTMKVLQYIIFGSIFFSLGSCQKEEKTIIKEDTQSFTKNSPIVGLLSRTSQNPTACDNVLDHSSCFSVQLPVTVIINNQQIIVSDMTHYQTVQNAIDAFSNDDDIINFIYPITIKYQNFQTQILHNTDELDDVLDTCGDDDGFDEIDCVALVYPITINLYNSNNQIANAVTINSNSSLFNFLENLGNATYVAISYPIIVVNSNGQTVVLNSNTELMNFIEDSIDDCNDDNLGGGSGNEPSLSQLLVNGSWYVYNCYYDGNDETNYYQGYNFTFNNNGSIVAQRNADSIDGEWDINDENGYQRLSLNFDGSNLHDIETNWRVIEYNSTKIKLKKQNSDTTDYLTFTKN